jgi:transposase InsO family protein
MSALTSTTARATDLSVLEWKVDSAASRHYCRDRSWFSSYTVAPSTVTIATGENIRVAGYGTIQCLFPSNAGSTEHRLVKLLNVQHVPTFAFNLISLPIFDSTGGEARAKDGICTLFDSKGRVIAVAPKKGGLYQLTARRPVVAASAITSEVPNEELKRWHERLGHLHHRAVVKLFASNMVADFNCQSIAKAIGESPKTAVICSACILGKHRAAPIKDSTDTRASRPMERIFMDIWGPARTQTPQGHRYFLILVDDFSRYDVLNTMGSKAEAFFHFKAYQARWAAYFSAHGHVISSIRTDPGGEFISGDFKHHLLTHGIQHEFTAVDTSQQNGVAERHIGAVMNAARSMRLAANLPATMWGEACKTAVYVRNRSPVSTVDGRTPFEAFTGKKPVVKHLRRFGCLGYYLNPIKGRDKLAARGIPCTFLGYNEDSPTYRLWDNVARKFVHSRSVAWDEDKMGWGVTSVARNGGTIETNDFPTTIDLNFPLDSDEPIEAIEMKDERKEQKEQKSDAVNSPPLVQPRPRGSMGRPRDAMERLQRQIGNRLRPGIADPHASPYAAHPDAGDPEDAADLLPLSSLLRLEEEEANFALLTADPTSYQEAINRPDGHMWVGALRDEALSLKKACTYTLVPRPLDRNVIGCKIVWKIKLGPNGEIIKYKARIVAKGYAQKYGVDYEDTYAPVVRYSSLRMIFSLSAHYDWEIHHMDVKSAYLNGDLEEEIYMEQPEGIPREEGKEDWVCLLHKALYGLKQAGRTWHAKIDSTFKARGFTPLQSDMCVYIKRTENLIIIIALYVDDIVLVSSNLTELNTLKADLSASYDMEDLGEVKYLLGIEISRNRQARTITITQSAYIKGVIQKHLAHSDVTDTVSTPMSTDARYVKALGDHQANSRIIKEYQSAVGSIMFAMLCTRPDIAYSVAVLSKYAHNPTPAHQEGIIRVLQYLRDTPQLGITYTGEPSITDEPQLLGYCDADWAADRDERKSITGYAFMLCGGAISWQSKKQTTVALSTVEAEYMAVATAAKEALWWRAQLSGLGFDTSQATTLHSDSKGCISLSKNPEHHSNTKHIDLRYHFIRDHVITKKTIHLQYINTTAMTADVLTKALSRDRHQTAVQLLGMQAI